MWKATCALVLAAAVPAAAQEYTIIAVSHADNLISEIDPATGTTLRTHVVMPGQWAGETHEGAVTPDGRTAYVSLPYAKQVLILDLETFTPRGTIESEHFSRVTPHSRTTSRGGTRDSTTADPHGVALNGDGGKLYVTLEYGEIPGVAVYDATAGRVSSKIDTIVAGNWLGVHPRTGKLYMPTRYSADRVVVIDTKTDRVIRVIALHAGSGPGGVAFGGPNNEVWVNGDRDGSISVIDGNTDRVINVIRPRGKGTGRVEVSPDGRFAVATQGTEASVIDTRTKEIVATLTIAAAGSHEGHGYPVFSPDGATLHVMDEISGDLVTFDMKDLKSPGRRNFIGRNAFGGGIRLLRK